MAAYTVQRVLRAGVTPTENAVSASDTFQNSGKTILLVENGSGGELTVTVVTPSTVDGLAVSDRTVTVANGAKKVIGPFPVNVYNDSDNNVTVNFSATSSVTCMALRI